MIHVYQIILAAVSAQSTNARIYEFLEEKLISSQGKPRLQVELNEFLTLRCEYLKTAHLLNNCGHPLSDATRKEQKKVLRVEVQRNSDLRRLVHRCQRRLWNLQSTGQPIPTCPTDWMYQDCPRLLELKQEQETQPLTVLCYLILDRYNLTHDKFIMNIIQSFQIEEMESQKRVSETTHRCVLSDTSLSVSNTQDEMPATSQVKSPELQLVIPDIADDKGQAGIIDSDDTTSCMSHAAAPSLPFPDIINIFHGVPPESVTASLSPSVLTPTSASVLLCSTSPVSLETSQENWTLDDSVKEFSIPDFSMSVFPDMPMVSWDTVIQDLQGEKASSIPSRPATTQVSTSQALCSTLVSDDEAHMSTSQALCSTLVSDDEAHMSTSQALCCTLVSDDKMFSECRLQVSPTFPMGVKVADLDSSLAPMDETSFVKSKKMMCPQAPVKTGIHVKAESQYPLVGSDIPHVYENRKIRKAHAPKSVSVETAPGDEMAIKREKDNKELDAKYARTKNFLREHSLKIYKESTAFYEKEQKRKRMALYTSRYLKQAAKCAQLVPPVAPATAAMTANKSNTRRDYNNLKNPVSTMSNNMVSTRKRKLSSDHTPVVLAKVTAMEARHMSPQRNSSVENPRLLLKLSREKDSWTSCQVVQFGHNRSS